MAGGRPTKYKPEYCEQLIEHMSEGYSYESFAGVIGVAKDTIYQWEKHQEFSDSKKIAFAKCNVFWERVAMDGMHDRNFSAPVWIFNMKNRFGWKDKKEIDHSVDAKIKIEKQDEGL